MKALYIKEILKTVTNTDLAYPMGKMELKHSKVYGKTGKPTNIEPN